MKKILSLCLAALMIFSVLPAAFAAEEVETIENIEETSEYAEAIKFLNTLDVYNGKGNGDLAADEGVERWQAARFIYRVATGDVAETDVKTTTNYTTFKDIDIGDFDGSSAETLGAIAWAAQAKITNGTSADEFSPTDGIIYQDAITMLVRLLGERYTAASYPYGFITTARELGITDGITGIGLEDEITRGVFAQLLYNAMFVEVDGITLAEKALNVGKTTVIITASNNLVYEAGATPVLRADMVRFAEIDAQGEPTGADYHVAASLFGLEDLKSANAAVGTLYNIYYEDTMADVLSAESLAEVYWNKGHDALTISASTTTSNLLLTKDKYITVGGKTYIVVEKYTDLNRKQGETSDPNGSDEMKVYFSDGGKLGLYNTKYMIASNGNIYLTSNPIVPEYYYSSLIDRYYQIGADGKWIIYTPEEMEYIVKEADTTVAGFRTVSAASVSAYTKATVSAGERVTLRNYRFGIIDWDQADRAVVYADGSKATLDKQYTFCFSTNTSTSATGWTAKAGNDNKDTKNDNELYMDEYTWTGFEGKTAAEIQKAIPNGSYVIYYFDDANKEVEILEVIDGAADDDDSYVMRGYLRNFNISSNTIGISESFSSAIVPYTCDYNTLWGAQLRSYHKDDNPTANFELFSELYDKYVELVVVDGKVAYIKALSTNDDYVIIDAFLDFTEDGVKVQGWSTIAEEYTTFTIKSFNGWTVGGNFDYYAYFLSGFFGTPNASFQSMIPFTSKTLYKVISEVDGVYDLTHAVIDPTDNTQHKGVNGATGNVLKVNEYGIIEGVNNKGVLNSLYWEPTAAGDYWMILDLSGDTPVVHQIKDMVNPVVEFTKGADVYVALDDFVIVVEDGEMIANDTFLGNSVEYFMYNKSVNLYNNQNFPGYTSYEYVLNMTNVLTNEIEKVVIDNGALNLGATGGYWADQMFESAGLVEGGIYKAVDNKIYKLDAVDYEAVANYYANTKNYEDSKDPVTGVARKANVAGKTFAQIVDIITADMDKLVTPDMVPGTTYHDSKVTIYYPAETRANPTLTGQNKIMGNSTSSSDQTKLKNYVADTGYEYNMYYVIGEDGKAVAWISRSEFSNAIYGVSKPVTTTAYGTITNGVFSGGSVIDEGQTAYIEYNQTHGEFWAYVNNANLTFKDNADWNNAQTNYKVIVTFVNGTTLTLPTADAAIKATQEGNGMNDLISGKATCCSVAFKYTGLGFEPDCVKTVTILIDKVGDARDCQFVIDCQ